MSKVANNKIQANSLADNKIQAKKPEVGDVWEFESEDDKFLVYVTNTEDYVHPHCITNKGETVFFWKHVFNCKYLGKSKVKLEELFDVLE